MRFLFLSLLLPVGVMCAVKTDELYAWLNWKYNAEVKLRNSYPESYNKCDYLIGKEWGWRPLLILDLYNKNGKFLESFQYDRFTGKVTKF